MKALYLRKGADRRLRGGHLWVYSNEVDTQRSSLAQYEAGDLVSVCSAGGDILGSAYMEPQSLICARLYAPGSERVLDEALVSEKLSSALALREALFEQPFYRLVYGDSDALPGVVIDRFDSHLVVQLNNGAIERYRDTLLAALVAQLSPAGIVLRQDSRARREQGLATESEVVFGEVPEQVALVENGVRFNAPVFSGQKTGWFYDHRASRAQLGHWVRDKSVLDVYSYIGGWGVQAAAHGASTVCCVDSSEQALRCVGENAQLNDVADRVQTRQGSAPAVMRELLAEQTQFDVVVLDPPAFVTRRKALKKGLAAYRRVNELGLKLLRPGGLLVTASCSMHVAPADLVSVLQQAAVRAGTAVRIVAQGGQGPDHPVHPAIPETQYLKTLFAVRD